MILIVLLPEAKLTDATTWSLFKVKLVTAAPLWIIAIWLAKDMWETCDWKVKSPALNVRLLLAGLVIKTVGDKQGS